MTLKVRFCTTLANFENQLPVKQGQVRMPLDRLLPFCLIWR